MRKNQSAGLLVYRITSGNTEFLLVHPGGPYNFKKDLGAWSIPKGGFADDELPLDAAKREFEEETGFPIDGDFVELSLVTQKAGKTVYAWAIEKDMDVTGFKSNMVSVEWPYKSGKFKDFPEVDRVEWLSVDSAKEKINPAQVALIDELLQKLGIDS